MSNGKKTLSKNSHLLVAMAGDYYNGKCLLTRKSTLVGPSKHYLIRQPDENRVN